VSPGEKKLGELVRELRERQGLSQAQLAERAQLALSYITLAESGQTVNLSPSALAAAIERAAARAPPNLAVDTGGAACAARLIACAIGGTRSLSDPFVPGASEGILDK